jgi:hypothetical protein
MGLLKLTNQLSGAVNAEFSQKHCLEPKLFESSHSIN